MKVAIVSGKGGSGKSSVTAAFVDLAQRVVAVDCDVDASNLPLLFEHDVYKKELFVSGKQLFINQDTCVGCGLCVEACAFHAIQLSEKLKAYVNNLLCEDCGLCVRLCPKQAIQMYDEAKSVIYLSKISKGIMAYGNLFPGDDNSGKMIAKLRDLADAEMKKEAIHLQILDGPPGIGCPVLSTVTGMDKVIIVSEPTLSGLSDLQRIYQVVHSFCKSIFVIINKCTINEENRKAIRHFSKAHNMTVVAELPFDSQFVEAQVHNQSIINYAPASVCAQQLIQAFENYLVS